MVVFKFAYLFLVPVRDFGLKNDKIALIMTGHFLISSYFPCLFINGIINCTIKFSKHNIFAYH